MTTSTPAQRACPSCLEQIRADALRCKHCHGTVTPDVAGHGGTCPLCKEDIHPDAVRCKHCQADLAPAKAGCGCGGGCSGSGRGERRSFPRPRRVAAQRSLARIETGPPSSLGGCSGCPAWVDDDGWFGILVECDDTSCTYAEY